MEKHFNVRLEKLPEGVYLATSDDIQGLVAKGRTVAETLEIARDVARRILEAKKERVEKLTLADVPDYLELPLTVGVD